MIFKPFGAGVPTEPDVAKLIEVFGLPAEGSVITWEQIEQAINLKRRQHRFQTVITAWKGRLESKHHILLRAVRGKGYQACDPNARVDAANDTMKSGFRKLRKSARIIDATDKSRLTPENRRAAEHLTNLGVAVKLAVATAAKQLPPINPEADGKGKPETN